MKQIIVGISLVLSIIVLAYIGLTDVELSKTINTILAIVIFIVILSDCFITWRSNK